LSTATDDKIEEESERFRAICFILRADKGCYAELLDDSKQSVFKRRDKYPTTVSDAYKFFIRTSRQVGYVNRRTNCSMNRFRQGQNRNFMFAQQGRHRNDENNNLLEVLAGRDGVAHEIVRCFSCNNMGHYSNHCLNSTGSNLAQLGVMLSQKSMI